MKYLSLPITLVKFWYLEGAIFWFRVLRNSLLVLEEDLAVTLMWRLLFVPLFHDTTIVGRVLSFLFRSFRILIGLIAFLIDSILIIILALIWFLLPILAFILIDPRAFYLKLALFSGLVLFIYQIFSHPPKKFWQLHLKTQANQPTDLEKIWQCSWINKNDLTLEKLLTQPKVKNFLNLLEQDPAYYQALPIPPLENILEKVADLAGKLGLSYLGPEHFLVGVLQATPNIENFLLKQNLKIVNFMEGLAFMKKKADWWRRVFIFDEDFAVRHLKGVNRGWVGVPTPSLDEAAEDLTRYASKNFIPDFVGRQTVIDRVINILSMEKGRNVVVVGEPGSGRTELALYLAKMIVSGNAPTAFATKRLVKLDLTRLMVGVTGQGDLAGKLQAIFADIKASGNIVIFIDEIENFGIGQANNQFSLYYLMQPLIESSDCQVITNADHKSYSQTVERNGSFARLFTKVELPPASAEETLEILKERVIENERQQHFQTSLLAIKKIVNLSADYVHDRVLPDSALQVLTECESKAQNGWLKVAIVEEVMQSRIKIPVGEIGSEKKQELLNLENLIHQNMVDQEEAVKAVANALRRAATSLKDKNRPIGSFLFVGPTGVGKTELSKILAQIYFQGRGQFLRFDMSEYQTTNSSEKLIGRVNEEGDLTARVRRNPYALILLDEFEKANNQIITLFLQVLEDGRLTDGTGTTVDFTNTIIIATSNAGGLTIAKGLEKGHSLDSLKEQIHQELLQIFKPELLNRFDEVVLFKSLTEVDLQKIVQLKLAVLQKQLKDQGYLVDFSNQLVTQLAKRGFDPAMGARPLRRLIQDTLAARLSVMILENKLPKGEKFLATEELIKAN